MNIEGISKPRAFVSSVVNNFEEYRDIARQALLNAGAEPVLVNEDNPSSPSSSRNVCLDAVDSCDIFISIVGERGGWTTPSGKLVIEEEYEHALRRKLPIVAFLQNTDRDAKAEEFERKVSDYVNGHFRVTFNDISDLKDKIEKAVRPLIKTRGEAIVDDLFFNKCLEQPYPIHNEATARLVIVPERQEEIFDSLDFDKPDFLRKIFDIGHAKGVDLFSYQESKSHQVESDSIVFSQGISGRDRGNEKVHLTIFENGTLSIDCNISGRHPTESGFSSPDMFVVLAEDIVNVLSSGFKFADKLFDEIDPYGRHCRFYYNVSVSNLGHRYIERNYKPKNSHQMNMNGDTSIVALTRARVVTRSDFFDSTSETERIVSMLIRHSGPR